MRVLIKKCDRCGKTISEQAVSGNDVLLPMPGKCTIVFSELTKGTENKAETSNETYEMCDDCAIAFLDWMKMKKEDACVVEASLSTSVPEKKPLNASIPEKKPYKLKPGTRTHHTWTMDEDDFIMFHSEGLTLKQIAYKLGVSLAAVQCRKYRLLNGLV